MKIEIKITGAKYYRSRYGPKAIYADGKLKLEGRTYDFNYTSDDDGFQIIPLEQENIVRNKLSDAEFSLLDKRIERASKILISKRKKLKKVII